MEKKKFKEKRLFERAPCSLTGEYMTCGSSSGTFICKDLSPRGMGALVSDPLAIGTHMNMQLPTKKQAHLSLDGKVRWCKQLGQTYRLGIEFDQPLFTPLSFII
jgi:hypothetical protein